MSKVSILIPTMTGGFNHLARLLPQLALEPDIDLIIIDNNSRDGTTNYLSNYACTVIINKANLGFAKANNAAGRIAQGEYLLLLNNDTVISKGFVGEMLKAFQADEKVGVVGCAIFTMDNPPLIQHAGICFTRDYVPYELGRPVASYNPGIPNNDDRVGSVREVPAVTGACLMIKKSLWDQLGGLNEAFINGWEDTDLCLRVREKGYKIWYTGKTSITHQRFGSHGRFNHERQNRELYDNIWVHTGRAQSVLGDFRES